MSRLTFPSPTCLLDLISVNQTLRCTLICRELHLLLVQEPEEVTGSHGGLARGVALVQTLDLSSSGGWASAPPHCALHAKTNGTVLLSLSSQSFFLFVKSRPSINKLSHDLLWLWNLAHPSYLTPVKSLLRVLWVWGLNGNTNQLPFICYKSRKQLLRPRDNAKFGIDLILNPYSTTINNTNTVPVFLIKVNVSSNC